MPSSKGAATQGLVERHADRRRVSARSAYNGLFELQRDIDNWKAATRASGVDEAFLPVAAPSSAIPDRKNEYYKTDEELVVALAEALRTE